MGHRECYGAVENALEVGLGQALSKNEALAKEVAKSGLAFSIERLARAVVYQELHEAKSKLEEEAGRLVAAKKEANERMKRKVIADVIKYGVGHTFD